MAIEDGDESPGPRRMLSRSIATANQGRDEANIICLLSNEMRHLSLAHRGNHHIGL